MTSAGPVTFSVGLGPVAFRSMMKAHWPPQPPSFLFHPYKPPSPHIPLPLPLLFVSPYHIKPLSPSLSPSYHRRRSNFMKPKDGFINKGPYNGSFIMHVCRPLRIVKNRHRQKEAFVGADDDDDDASSGMLLVEAGPLLF